MDQDNAIKEHLSNIFPHIEDHIIQHYLNEAKRSTVDLANILPLSIDLVLSSQIDNNNHAKGDIIFLGSTKVESKSKQKDYSVVYVDDEPSKPLIQNMNEVGEGSKLVKFVSDSDNVYGIGGGATPVVGTNKTPELIGQDDHTPDSMLHFVTQMFPNVNSAKVKELVKQGNGLDDIVSHVLTYPEMCIPGEPSGLLKSEEILFPLQPKEKEINYYTEKLSSVSQLYEVQCLALLKNDFRKLYAADIRKAMAKCHYQYAATRKLLEDSLLAMGYNSSDDSDTCSSTANQIPVMTSPQYLNSSNVLITHLLGRKRNIAPIQPVLDSELVKELNFVKKQKTMKEEEKNLIYAQHLNEQQYKDEGQLIECGCCLGEFPFEEVVQCSDAHLFCCECLQGYAKEVIFGSAIGTAMLHCMTQGCTKPFPYSQLRKALSDDEIAKYQDHLQEDCLMNVNIPNLVQCPHCTFKAIMAVNEKVFTCLKPDCMKATCKDCQEDWKEHIGLKCNEVEKKSQTNLRLSYEERMTIAKVRNCSKCSMAFTKSEGCNKMTCRCGTTMCYLCRKGKINYHHFCSHPRDPGRKCDRCSKCSLWTDPKEDEDLAIKQLEDDAIVEKRKLEDAIFLEKSAKKQKV